MLAILKKLYFRLTNKQLLLYLATGGAVSFIVVAVWYFGFLQTGELFAYDTLLRKQPAQTLDERVTIVGVTNEDSRRIGFPLSDGKLAEALGKLIRLGASTVGVTISRDVEQPPGSKQLADLLQAQPRIIWSYSWGKLGTETRPPHVLENTKRVGFNDLLLDDDGVVRRAALYMGSYATPSFPLAVTLHYLAEKGIAYSVEPNQTLRLGQIDIPRLPADAGGYRGLDNRGHQILLEYPGLPERIPRFTLSQLILGEIPEHAIRGKLVLLGGMDDTAKYHLTPFTPALASQDPIYSLEHHAYTIIQLLRLAERKTILLREAPSWIAGLWIVFGGLLGAGFGYWQRRSSLWKIFLGAAGIGAFILFAWGILLNYGWWFPAIAPLLALLLTLIVGIIVADLVMQRSHKRIIDATDKVMAVEMAVQHRTFFTRMKAFTKPVRITVLFVDIVGFSSIMEGLASDKQNIWLGIYTRAMADIVRDVQGVVDKFTGDGLMAIFMEDDDNGLRQAVRCAWNMGERLHILNERWFYEGLPTTQVRIGIYTGEVEVSSMAGTDTVVGNTVNIARRLEGYEKDKDSYFKYCAKTLPCRILIGCEISKTPDLKDRFETECIAEQAELPGITKRVAIYRIINKQTSVIEDEEVSHD